MGHFAILDEHNIVVQVITGRNEDEVVDGISDWEAHYSEVTGLTAVRTSYNANFRNEYAGIGGTYDPAKDRFVSATPYPSWVLNDTTGKWEAPIAGPWTTDAEKQLWYWDEESISWKEVRLPD